MTPEQRRAWLDERRTGIGGSDAAAACGLSKYKTRLELYLDKRGELETTENEPMLWGHLLEPVVRQEYANRTGRTVVVPEGIIRHPTVKFALMTPDGIADASRVLQVKTARTGEGWGEPGSADIPQEYVLQTQHEMFVTQLNVADVAVLIGGSDFRIYVIERDAELQAMLLEQEAAFWQMVQSSEPPAPVSREDVKRRWRISSGSSVPATPEIVRTAELLSAAKRLKKLAEDREDQLAVLIQSHMGEAAELIDAGEPIATWRNVNASPRFDLDRFKEEQPMLWKQYLRLPSPRRQFLLKKLPSLAKSRFAIASESLVAMGGELTAHSESGSMYFDLPGNLHVRVSDHDPNEATAAWMSRRYVRSVRVDMDDWREQLDAISGEVQPTESELIA